MKVLQYLENRGCPFVPHLLESDPAVLRIVTSNCGSRVEHLDAERQKEIYDELLQYGVRHEDAEMRNVTYSQSAGRFCLIDFEFATILDEEKMDHPRNVSDVQRVHWSGHTDCGHVRPNNEDSFLALRFNAQELEYLGKVGEAPTGPYDFVFAVSDGMGGAHAGEFASRITVDKITHLLPRSFQHSALGLQAGFKDIFEELFAQIHRALVFVGDSDEEINGMQSTLSLCWFAPGWMSSLTSATRASTTCPKGAGRVEAAQPRRHLRRLAPAHRPDQRARGPRHHPRRTALQKALGGGTSSSIPTSAPSATEPGDQFLLCTDGLTEGLYDSQLFELLRHPDPIAATAPPARRLSRLRWSARGRTTPRRWWWRCSDFARRTEEG